MKKGLAASIALAALYPLTTPASAGIVTYAGIDSGASATDPQARF